MLIAPRTVLRRRTIPGAYPRVLRNAQIATFHASPTRFKAANISDPRARELDDLISDEFASTRSSYQAPKHSIILAHGLLGFEELHLEPPQLRSLGLPGIAYWRGITDALAAQGVEVITASVPPSGSIEARAAKLAEKIGERAQGRAVNIIAGRLSRNNNPELSTINHGHRGLDSRYMISSLKPPGVKVLSLTTIATPHRGSTFADWMFKRLGPFNIPKLYKAMEYIGFETGAFEQLTQEYMTKSFNPRTPDDPSVRYFSYGATLRPHLTSVFRKSHNVIEPVEGPNDGLVSVQSSRWGEYKGTLDNVSHLDLINWTNRLRWYLFELTGHKRNFNAIAFYLHITDMLAREGF